MPIWFSEVTVESMKARSYHTMVDHIGIEYIEVGDDYIKARMPVDHRTVQPARILHGGASVALAETLGSIAAYQCIDPAQKTVVGLEINANHVRSVREGYVTGTVKPLHIGRSTHIWQILVRDDRERLVCISRITMAVLDHPNRPEGSEVTS
jgi:1,4-dihydroxy-2-naphthoyl-CoA hydrolase